MGTSAGISRGSGMQYLGTDCSISFGMGSYSSYYLLSTYSAMMLRVNDTECAYVYGYDYDSDLASSIIQYNITIDLITFTKYIFHLMIYNFGVI